MLISKFWPKHLSIQYLLAEISFILVHELFIMLISFSFLFWLIKL
jgi:hypothetical protein